MDKASKGTLQYQGKGRMFLFHIFLLLLTSQALKITPKRPITSRRGTGYAPKSPLRPGQVQEKGEGGGKALERDGNGKALKVTQKWACIEGCGACCHLDLSIRPHTLSVFEEDEDKQTYMSLIGDDGWCINFDQQKKGCTVYEDRPWFCRVQPDTFEEMYGTEEHEMDEFCTSCCRETIEDEYGVKSEVLKRFNAVIAALDRGESVESVEMQFQKNR